MLAPVSPARKGVGSSMKFESIMRRDQATGFDGSLRSVDRTAVRQTYVCVFPHLHRYLLRPQCLVSRA